MTAPCDPQENPQAPAIPDMQAEWRAAVLMRLGDELQARNLRHAVTLAQMAAMGRGPLVDHFAELGRRYAHVVDKAAPRPRLRLIEGRDA